MTLNYALQNRRLGSGFHLLSRLPAFFASAHRGRVALFETFSARMYRPEEAMTLQTNSHRLWNHITVKLALSWRGRKSPTKTTCC
jgi:hypothetical protein